MSPAGGRAAGAARTGVLLAAGDAAWERPALEALAGGPGGSVTLLKRCLDLGDLLAAAETGTAEVAVVGSRLAGLDADAFERLARTGVRVVVVLDDARGGPDLDPRAERARLLRMGAAAVLDQGAATSLPEHCLTALRRPAGADRSAAAVGDGAPGWDLLLEEARDDPERLRGRLVAVWGPHGAPGRTTLAVALTALAAERGRRACLVDADPYGGTVAAQLAVLDGASGLLAAARLANHGQLDRVRLSGLARRVAPSWRVLTGLPRPERWPEVRPAALADVLDVAVELDDLVVVDAGPGLPAPAADPLGGQDASREATTAVALDRADLVLVVGTADPVGLVRLARALRDLLETRPDACVQVAVNRMRPTLGWTEAEVRGLLDRVVSGAPPRFLPDDGAAADRALAGGRPLSETAGGRLRAQLLALHDDVAAALGPTTAVTVRRAGRWRSRARHGRQTDSSR